MSTYIAVLLLGSAGVLFVAARKRWIDNETLHTIASISSAIALLASIAVLVVPTTPPGKDISIDAPISTGSGPVDAPGTATLDTADESSEAKVLTPPMRDNTSARSHPTVPPMMIPTASVLSANEIPFNLSFDPQSLNPILGWRKGGSSASAYDVAREPDTLMLIAGPRTEQWLGRHSAPAVLYPMAGDFETEVRVDFSPTHKYQIAGLGIVSASDDQTFLRISRLMGDAGQSVSMQSNAQGVEYQGRGVQYADDRVYLKIERIGSLYSFLYSSNGTHWDYLEQDYVFSLPVNVEVYLVAYSTNDSGIVARFAHLRVSKK